MSPDWVRLKNGLVNSYGYQLGVRKFPSEEVKYFYTIDDCNEAEATVSLLAGPHVHLATSHYRGGNSARMPPWHEA